MAWNLLRGLNVQIGFVSRNEGIKLLERLEVLGDMVNSLAYFLLDEVQHAFSEGKG